MKCVTPTFKANFSPVAREKHSTTLPFIPSPNTAFVILYSSVMGFFFGWRFRDWESPIILPISRLDTLIFPDFCDEIVLIPCQLGLSVCVSDTEMTYGWVNFQGQSSLYHAEIKFKSKWIGSLQNVNTSCRSKITLETDANLKMCWHMKNFALLAKLWPLHSRSHSSAQNRGAFHSKNSSQCSRIFLQIFTFSAF